MKVNATKLKKSKNIQTKRHWRTFDDDQHGADKHSSGEEHICSKGSVKKSIKYYLENTTLHGLKYLAEDRITIFERVFFGLSFVAVVILCGFFISNVYAKWSASPIIIATSSRQTLISEVPFPAITICNLNLASKSKVEKIEPLTSNFSLLMSLCDQGSNVSKSYIGTWKYFKHILTEVAQPCQDMLLYCSFGAEQHECSTIFNSILTDDGLCCNFNGLDLKFLLKNFSDDNRLTPGYDHHYEGIEWTPESGYAENLPLNFYPQIGGGVGTRMGLSVILNSSASEYFCSKTKSIGFKILIHSPAEQPKISNYGFLISAGREARIPLEINYQDAVPSIRSIRKEIRRCLFSDEGDLVYYRIYSRKNCELECEARILQQKCGCTLYYLPKLDPSIRICGPNDNLCTNRIQSLIESKSDNVSCNECLPGCFELTYRAMITSTTLVADRFLSNDIYPNEIFDSRTNVSEISILHFYYLTNIFRSTTKMEMFGFTEFLSNTGGLLGLFMGFSILSLIEIVYYVTLRPYCANRAFAHSTKYRKTILASKPLTPIKRQSYRPELNAQAWTFDSAKRNMKNKNYMNNILLKFQRHEDEEPKFPYLN